MRYAFLLMLFISATVSTPIRAADAPSGLPLGIAVSGLVGRLLVANGAHVEAGDPILQMDCRPQEQQIKVRAADLSAAEAAFERVRNGPRPDEIAIGEANLGVAQARAEEAEDAYARLKGLTEGVSVTRAQLLESRRDARISDAQLNDAQKRLALLHAGSRQEDVAEALARRDSAAAQLSFAQAQLDQCTLRAPIAGAVELLATPGQFISDMTPTTLAILRPNPPTH